MVIAQNKWVLFVWGGVVSAFFVTVVLTFVLGLLFQMTLVSNTFSGYIVGAEVFIVGSVMERQEGEALNSKQSKVILYLLVAVQS